MERAATSSLRLGTQDDNFIPDATPPKRGFTCYQSTGIIALSALVSAIFETVIPLIAGIAIVVIANFRKICPCNDRHQRRLDERVHRTAGAFTHANNEFPSQRRAGNHRNQTLVVLAPAGGNTNDVLVSGGGPTAYTTAVQQDLQVRGPIPQSPTHHDPSLFTAATGTAGPLESTPNPRRAGIQVRAGGNPPPLLDLGSPPRADDEQLGRSGGQQAYLTALAGGGQITSIASQPQQPLPTFTRQRAGDGDKLGSSAMSPARQVREYRRMTTPARKPPMEPIEGSPAGTVESYRANAGAQTSYAHVLRTSSTLGSSSVVVSAPLQRASTTEPEIVPTYRERASHNPSAPQQSAGAGTLGSLGSSRVPASYITPATPAGLSNRSGVESGPF